jgi:S1-C subfamily serine protease
MALAVLLSVGVGYAAVSLAIDGGGKSSVTYKAPLRTASTPTAAPAWLGVQAINFPTLNGVLVMDVTPGSPADEAGLQPGDVITQLGNQAIANSTDLQAALASMHPGQQVQVHYELGAASYTTTATLRVRPLGGP